MQKIQADLGFAYTPTSRNLFPFQGDGLEEGNIEKVPIESESEVTGTEQNFAEEITSETQMIIEKLREFDEKLKRRSLLGLSDEKEILFESYQYLVPFFSNSTIELDGFSEEGLLLMPHLISLAIYMDKDDSIELILEKIAYIILKYYQKQASDQNWEYFIREKSGSSEIRRDVDLSWKSKFYTLSLLASHFFPDLIPLYSDRLGNWALDLFKKFELKTKDFFNELVFSIKKDRNLGSLYEESPFSLYNQITALGALSQILPGKNIFLCLTSHSGMEILELLYIHLPMKAIEVHGKFLSELCSRGLNSSIQFSSRKIINFMENSFHYFLNTPEILIYKEPPGQEKFKVWSSTYRSFVTFLSDCDTLSLEQVQKTFGQWFIALYRYYLPTNLTPQERDLFVQLLIQPLSNEFLIESMHYETISREIINAMIERELFSRLIRTSTRKVSILEHMPPDFYMILASLLFEQDYSHYTKGEDREDSNIHYYLKEMSNNKFSHFSSLSMLDPQSLFMKIQPHKRLIEAKDWNSIMVGQGEERIESTSFSGALTIFTYDSIALSSMNRLRKLFFSLIYTALDYRVSEKIIEEVKEISFQSPLIKNRINALGLSYLDLFLSSESSHTLSLYGFSSLVRHLAMEVYPSNKINSTILIKSLALIEARYTRQIVSESGSLKKRASADKEDLVRTARAAFLMTYVCYQQKESLHEIEIQWLKNRSDKENLLLTQREFDSIRKDYLGFIQVTDNIFDKEKKTIIPSPQQKKSLEIVSDWGQSIRKRLRKEINFLLDCLETGKMHNFFHSYS
jgi:hypothetical protein